MALSPVAFDIFVMPNSGGVPGRPPTIWIALAMSLAGQKPCREVSPKHMPHASERINISRTWQMGSKSKASCLGASSQRLKLQGNVNR